MNEQVNVNEIIAEGTVKEPGLAISVSSQIKPGRQIILQCYLGRDDPPSQHHAYLDRLSHMVERQEAIDEIAGAKFQLAFVMKEYEDHKLQYVKISERNKIEWNTRGKKGIPILSKAEEAAKNNVENNLKKNKLDIEKWEKKIAELEATIAKVD